MPTWLYAYVRAVAGYLAEGYRIPSQEKLAAECHVHRVTVAKALGRPAIRAWVVEQLAAADAFHTRLIKNRIAGQALAGSKDQQRIWLELQGELGSRPSDGGGGPRLGDGWSVTINVPLPPAAAPIDVAALPAAGVGA